MIKLLLCLACGIATGLYMLDLRHQQLELRHQTAELHDKIKAEQAKLWSQQLQIATLTSPNSIHETVRGLNLDIAPRFLTHRPNWIDQTSDAPTAVSGH